MAEVLTVASTDSELNYPIRRTSSQPTFLLDPDTRGQTTVEKSDYKAAYRLRESSRSSASAPSSAPSSPQLPQIDFSNSTSCLSTPSSSLSLDDTAYDEEDEDEDEDDDILFPNYGATPHKSLQHTAAMSYSMDTTPRGSPSREKMQKETESYNPEPAPGRLSRSESTNLSTIADDTAAKPQPSRHVDYLSHDWKEEDIWSSWRHIVAKRGCLENWERLENASWRTWMKTQRCLSTINPDKLNWMKDHDVTWLYGPLQSGSNIHFEDSALRSAFSRTDSFAGKKPILKKRSISEVMLQRSISSQSLMRQATDSIRAQAAAYEAARPGTKDRDFSSIMPRSSPVNSSSSDRTVPESPSPMQSYASSDSGTPEEGRHIHFNETVEQCIAISSDSDEPDFEDTVFDEEDEHSSDDEFLTLKTDRSMERKLSRSATPRNSFSDGCSGNKTIAMLPATTLKYRSDTPELQLINGPTVPPRSGLRESSSQETLRPVRPQANFLLDDDGDDYDLDPDWTPSAKSPIINRETPNPARGTSGQSPRSSQIGLDLYRDDNDELQHRGMRRTPSGMFMPYEEGDEEISPEGDGLFGKVYDTYNTARDIAHVIWNVGWRR